MVAVSLEWEMGRPLVAGSLWELCGMEKVGSNAMPACDMLSAGLRKISCSRYVEPVLGCWLSQCSVRSPLTYLEAHAGNVAVRAC